MSKQNPNDRVSPDAPDLTENRRLGYAAISKQLGRVASTPAPKEGTPKPLPGTEPRPEGSYPSTGYSHLDHDGNPRHKRK